MDAIEAVLELAKERDELSNIIETYDDMLETLVGKTVILATGRKSHRRFVECKVTEFHGADGWEIVSIDDDEVYMVTFADFTSGKVQLA